MKTLTMAALALLFAQFCSMNSARAADGALVVEDLQCRGNSATSCAFILGQVYIAQGDLLDEAEVQNSLLRLSTLRMFESVHIYLEKGSERGKAVVIVEVEEANPLYTEWLLGATYNADSLTTVAAGRLTHQNLFGAGKLADVTAVVAYPIDQPSEEAYVAALRYADPHLFDSKRYFAVASAIYVDQSSSDEYGNFSETNVLRFGVSLGRRLWDFSYITAGYGYRAKLDAHSGRWQRDGTFELKQERNRHVYDLLYGWNSEDDLYFPTRGSSFHIGGGWDFGDEDDSDNFYLQFRKTWRVGDGFASFKLGGDPNPEYRQTFSQSQFLALSYAQPIAPGDTVRRGRWYVELGYSGYGFAPEGEKIHTPGLKAGVRIETHALGLIDLYFLGIVDMRP